MTTEAVCRAIDRAVTLEELRDALERPISTADRDEVVSLCRWFTTRYPSPESRLAYVRQAYVRWARARLPTISS